MAKKLMDEARAAFRAAYYSHRTEEQYLNWMRRFILFHGKRHPREMGAEEIQQFLNHLATEGKVSASRSGHRLRIPATNGPGRQGRERPSYRAPRGAGTACEAAAGVGTQPASTRCRSRQAGGFTALCHRPQIQESRPGLEMVVPVPRQPVCIRAHEYEQASPSYSPIESVTCRKEPARPGLVPTHQAELHWYEATGIGKREIKIKYLLD